MFATALLLAIPLKADVPEFSKELQASAVAATVRIVNGAEGTDGSGAIIRIAKPFVYILTAHHVAGQGERLEVYTYSATSYPKPASVYRSAKVIARAPEQDVALLQLATDDPMPGRVALCPPSLVQDLKGINVLTVGCTTGKAPTCAVEKVRGKKLVQKERGTNPVSCWEVEGPATIGRSGGPLIDKRGYLFGVCSGTSDGRSYYCAVEEIHGFLKRHGLRWLYEEIK